MLGEDSTDVRKGLSELLKKDGTKQWRGDHNLAVAGKQLCMHAWPMQMQNSGHSWPPADRQDLISCLTLPFQLSNQAHVAQQCSLLIREWMC